jgi:hypothetical protein
LDSGDREGGAASKWKSGKVEKWKSQLKVEKWEVEK